MAEYEVGMGGAVEDTATTVTFRIVVRTPDGKATLGSGDVVVTKPLSEAKVRLAVKTAADNIIQGNPQDFIQGVLRRMNSGG